MTRNATEETAKGKRHVAAGDDLRFRLTIAYDGTRYQGWQVQKTGTGVQEKIEQAVARIFPSRPRLHGSSRTDTGVHALGLVAHLDLPRAEFRMPVKKLALALNAWLPEDIRVVSAVRARRDFHARFDASGKQYRYQVWNHAVMNPLVRHTAWHVPQSLRLDWMRAAARVLLGTHDFQSFTASTGYRHATTVRTLYRLDIRTSGPSITFLIEGDGFLYKMCRGIVGTLVQVGQGKISTDDVQHILAHRDRRVAGMTAPAWGLVLWKVFYGRSPQPSTGQPG